MAINTDTLSVDATEQHAPDESEYRALDEMERIVGGVALGRPIGGDLTIQYTRTGNKHSYFFSC